MQMLFGKGSEVKLGAGYVLDYLAQEYGLSVDSIRKIV